MTYEELKQNIRISNLLWWTTHGDNYKTTEGIMPSYEQMGDDLIALEHSNEMLEQQNAELEREIERLHERVEELTAIRSNQNTYKNGDDVYEFVVSDELCCACDLYAKPDCTKAPCSASGRIDNRNGIYKKVKGE